MISATPAVTTLRRPRFPSVCLVLACLFGGLGESTAQEPVTSANFKQATRFSSTFLRKFVYDTRVQPQWIGDSERFWYRYRTSVGARYWLVDAVARTKVALFDHELLAALLSEACETPMDADNLALANVKFDDAGDVMTFDTKKLAFSFVRSTGKLEKKGKASAPPARTRRGSSVRGRRTSTQGSSSDARSKAAREAARKQLVAEWERKVKEFHAKAAKAKAGKADEETDKDEEEERNRADPRRRGRARSGSPFSPDLRLYVFARKHDLYVVERSGELPPPAVKASTGKEGNAKDEGAKGGAAKSEQGLGDRKMKTRRGAPTRGASRASSVLDDDGDDAKKAVLPLPFDETKAVRLTEDGEEDYSFGGSSTDDYSVPARVSWAPDSTSFFVTRRDTRGVAELFLVDSLGQPRPTLSKYKYPMPGEDKVRRSELMVFDAASRKLIPIEEKWKDESYSDVRWLENGELRVLRRDRLLRNVEYGVLDPKTGAFKALFRDGVKNANLNTQSIRYLQKRNELIWWSERSGWGHFYLYGLDGQLKNPITRGRYRASRIVDVDEEKGILWFYANGREKGESVYHEHLYSVRLDGGGLTLLDPGDATHRSSLSKSRKFVVDNCSRVDMKPRSVLRDGEGKHVMLLEEADLTQVEALGWRPPSRFVVKAADGVTDLYGNMWKPFDFDETKKYPIIVNVYPGPQQEGVSHTFSATSSRQDLAQVGFIVIQVGHRGGAPTRSKAYGSYGYKNLRDYGLEDKKTAIEQLAARHSFIDIDRIGIYGHSGGGFMTAAALLKPPYNDFFKVGVATSGNHDNNVYNNTWAERYHGLTEVKAKTDTKSKTESETSTLDRSKTGTVQRTDRSRQQLERRGRRSRRGGGTQRGEQGTRRGREGVTTRRNGAVSVSKKGDATQSETKQDATKQDATKQGLANKGNAKKGDAKKGDAKQGVTEKGDATKSQKAAEKTKFEIKVATNAELAANLKGKLLLIHGEIDNNVHPAGTMRLVDALIKANKRFDMLIIPGARHGYGRAAPYATQRTWEFFAEHLLGDRQPGADINEKAAPRK